MEKLYEIIEKAKQIEKSDKSNLEKMKELYNLQNQASKETWSDNKEYRLKANDVYEYVQTKWNLIYLESDKKIRKEMDKVINNV